MNDVRLGLPSASGFHMDAACDGRQNLVRALRGAGLLVADETEWTARGTRIHNARTTGNTLNLEGDAELDAYKKGLVLETEAVDRWMTERVIDALPGPLLEERLWLNHPETGEPLMSGQLDVAFRSFWEALILDWKSGSGYYLESASLSWQLRIYALLIWKEFDGIKRIRVGYIMPEKWGKGIDTFDLTEYDLKQIETAVYHILWKQQQPDARRTAGAHCRFCPARANCPEAAQMTLMPTVQRGPDEIGTLALVKAMTPDDCYTVWSRRSELKAILGAITERLEAATDDHARLGLKFTKGKDTSYILDVEGAVKKLRDEGFAERDIFDAMSFSKPAIIEMIRGRTFCTKEVADAWYARTFGEFIQEGRGKPTLVEK